MTLKWPDFYPDYKLHETPPLGTPFEPSARGINTQDRSINVEVNSAEAKAGFFRLEVKNAAP